MTTDQQRLLATRRDTVASVKAAGFHRRYPNSVPFLQSLQEYLESMEGGNKPQITAKGFVAVVARYLYFCDPRRVRPKFVTDVAHISHFANTFKRQTTASASTIKMSLNALKYASAYIKHAKMPRTDTHRKVLKVVQNFQQSLNKCHARRKAYNRQHRLLADANTPDLQDAASKLKAYSPTIRALVSQDQLTKEERNTVTSYLVSRIAIENAARSSHITNLGMAEFHTGETIGTERICMCAYSKTGTAPVIFTEDMYELTKAYVRQVRVQIPGATCASSAPVFLTNAGNRLTNVSGDRHLYKVLRLAGVNQKFSLTQLRKAVTTNAARRFANSPHQLSLVNRYLCHSDLVAAQHYTAAFQSRDYHDAFLLLRTILGL